MGENTAIEWATHTFNPWIGCTKVSPGCANCYAEAYAKRYGRAEWGPGKPRQRTSEANWRKPLSWDRAQVALVNAAVARCSGCGFYTTDPLALSGCNGYCQDPTGESCDAIECPQCERLHYWCGSFEKPPRPRVFCASLADWLDPEVPAEWLADLLCLIYSTPNLDWLMLTKRPELWRGRLSEAATAMLEDEETYPDVMLERCRRWGNGEPPINVWVGTTVEDQQRADERIPKLLEIPARVRFLSCEPLLGPVDLSGGRGPIGPDALDLDWVIVGGESGPGARPMHPDWAWKLHHDCENAGVPFFFKQWGAWAPFCGLARDWPPGAPRHTFYADMDHGIDMARVGKKRAGRELDGRTWDEVPS